MMIEDPSLRFSTDQETGQMVLEGMGELHLEVVVDRLKTERGVEVNTGRPQVAYRYELSRAVDNIIGRVKKQTGGRGQYAHIVCDFATGENGFEFHNKVVGGAVPKEFIMAAKKGIEAYAEGGAGYPIMNMVVTIHDGDTHAVDSSEFAFREAGQIAAEAAAKAAGLTLMEPLMDVEIIMPEESFGSVMGDIQKRRGQILHSESHGGEAYVKAKVALAEMFGYTTALRSLTQGRGVATMTSAGYAPAPVLVSS
jgi:elongation factor G